MREDSHLREGLSIRLEIPSGTSNQNMLNVIIVDIISFTSYAVEIHFLNKYKSFPKTNNKILYRTSGYLETVCDLFIYLSIYLLTACIHFVPPPMTGGQI